MNKSTKADEVLRSNDFVLLLPAPSTTIVSAFNRKLGERRGVVIEGEAAREMISLYSLYSFSEKVIIGSFDEPYGRKLRNLLNCGIATEEELINDVILGAM